MSTPEGPNDSQQVRLPELPIFQKYSIALRQEFAEAGEFASILEKTLAKLRSQRASALAPRSGPDEAQEKAPAAPPPSPETEAEADAGFWELASPDAPNPRSDLPPRPPRKARPKRKPPPPAIVRVSSSGKPIIESNPPASKNPANKSPKK